MFLIFVFIPFYAVYYGYDFAICYFIVSSCLVVLFKYCFTLTIQFERVLSAADETVRVFWRRPHFTAFCWRRWERHGEWFLLPSYTTINPTGPPWITPNAGWQGSVTVWYRWSMAFHRKHKHISASIRPAHKSLSRNSSPSYIHSYSVEFE